MTQFQDSKSRLMIAWVSWLLMLCGGGMLLLGILAIIILYYIGGITLLSEVWAGTENKSNNYSSILYPLIFISFPVGCRFGIWLWAKFARKIKLVSDEKISKMCG
jgi:H+/Cl- antiporter ClcA